MKALVLDENGIPKITESDIIEWFYTIQYDLDDVLSCSIDEDDFGGIPSDESWWDMILNPEDYNDEVCQKWLFDNLEEDDEKSLPAAYFIAIAETDEELEIETSLERKADIAFDYLMEAEAKIAFEYLFENIILSCNKLSTAGIVITIEEMHAVCKI